MRDHPTTAELEAALEHVRDSPADAGPVRWIVRRPAEDEREVLEAAELDPASGLVGDDWGRRPSSSTADGGPHPGKQLTLMNARAIACLAGEPEHWGLAGDQLYVDLDLSEANLPAGTRLRLGSAEIEVSVEPHTGCKKFAQRFGKEALKFFNSERGKALRLRGLNARVLRAGAVRVGDAVSKA